MIPYAKAADTLYINKKGEVKILNDWSQVFTIRIPKSDKNTVDIINELNKFEDVEYAEPPVEIKFDYTPNDLHEEGYQWYLPKIYAEYAWDITKGSNSIKIAVIEAGVASHDDIDNKLTGGETGSAGAHGLMVAGVAGCETNNDEGLASLGYNTMVVPRNYGTSANSIAADILDAADPYEDDADIINCSFKTINSNANGYYSYSYQVVEDAIEDAINWGKIVVASAGNPPVGDDLDTVPFTQWPAAYDGVIGVSATNNSDAFPSGYNYGSHVDLSAPGIGIRVLDLNNSFDTVDGTSFSSPLVCALAALVLSNDSNLSRTQIQKTLELSAKDLGTSDRDDYYGHGRINAYEAVRSLYVPDVYNSISDALNISKSGQKIIVTSGNHSLSSNITIPSGRTLVVSPNVTLTFSGSYKLNVYGSFKCEGSPGSYVTINGQNYYRSNYYDSMVDIKDGASADIQYTNFINSSYHLIVSSSADAEISHSSFSNFGFSTSSRAVSLHYCTGDVEINNCTFTGSGSKGIGVYSNNTGTNVTISENTFSNCRYGIRCYSSDALLSGNSIPSYYYYAIYSDNVGTDAEYWDNEITGNFSSYGVYLNSSSPYLYENTITNSKVFINSCSPSFAEPPSSRGYNTVTDAGAPLIYVQNYSTPYMGYDYNGGYNSIYDTDLPHIYASNHSGVYADRNYWGAEGPANQVDGTSWVLDRYPLNFNPNLSKSAVSSSEDGSVRPYEKEDEAEFMAAVDAGFNSDYAKAKELLHNLIYKETNSRFPALSVLMYDYFTKRELNDKKSTRSENVIQNELTTLVNDLCKKDIDDPLRPFGLKLSARESALDKDYNSLSSFNSQIISEYPNSIHEMTSLFDEISYQVEVKEDFVKAKDLLLRMDKAYPGEKLTLMAHVLLGENVDLYDSKLPKLAENTEISYIPTKFKMHPAFPNPFNPVTIIKYELPEEVHVKLSVYNINGQKIQDLMAGNREAGVHEVQFDGSKLPSGMYFYKIIAGKFSDVKRFLLIK
jgi:hypothetical protein